jgi:hypothetical protein
VDERVWAVQPCGACGHKVTKQGWVRWRKIKPGAGPQAGWPRPAGQPPIWAPWCSPSAGKSPIQFFVRVLKCVV